MTIGMTANVAELYRLYGIPPIGGGSGEGEAGGDAGGAGGESGGEAGGESGELQDAGKAALEAERKRAREADRRARELEKRLKEFEDRDKSDLDKTAAERDELKARVEAAEAKARAVAAKATLLAEAAKAGAANPDVIYRLVKDQAEFDDEGEVTNAATLIQAAKKDAPQLFTVTRGGGNGGSRDQQGNGGEITPGLGRLRYAYGQASKTRG